MKTKRLIPTLVLFIFIFILSLAIYASAVIIDFRGSPGTNKVTLNWSTLSELNCKGFEIERGLSTTDFKKIGFVEGAGNSTTKTDYLYEDKNVYKSNMDRTFYYRLIIVDNNNVKTSHSEIVSVTPSISGARYTWGSIKALFR
ncbi:MAG TPA: hypothetical protein ENN22_14430 [bacterium]|nr:hypothetical protein [bacterium]